MSKVVEAFKKINFFNIVLHDVSKHNNVPRLDYFESFSAILVIGDSGSFINEKECSLLGDNLYDFLTSKNEKSSGRGVLIASFAHCSNVETGFITGKIKKHDLYPIKPGSQSSVPHVQGAHTLEFENEKHFLTTGVGTITFAHTNGDCSREGANAQATVIAKFSQSKGLAAVAEMHVPVPGTQIKRRIIGLNFFPYFEENQVNLDKMMANCFLYATCAVQQK